MSLPDSIDHEGNPRVHRAFGRVTGRRLGRNPYVRASFRGLSAAFRATARAARAFFLETMGLFFLLFVLIGAVAVYREYQAYGAGRAGIERAAVALVFTAIFAYFAVTSFLRARK